MGKKRRCTSAFTVSTEITEVVARLAFYRHSNVFIWNKHAVGHRVGSADSDLREKLGIGMTSAGYLYISVVLIGEAHFRCSACQYLHNYRLL